MRVNFTKSQIDGSIIANPSKSYEQRALIAALLSRSECYISNFGNSDDVIATRKALESIGSSCKIIDAKLLVSPNSISNKTIIDCKESATLARIIAPVACVFKNKFKLTGSGTLLKRPIAKDFFVFRDMGSKLSYSEDKLPVDFSQIIFKNGVFNIDGSNSSQLISGLIMALPVVFGDSQLIIHNPVSTNYILMTIEIVKLFGVKIKYEFEAHNMLVVDIAGNQTYKAHDYSVEGDWSSAAFMIVAGAISGKVNISGLNNNSLQADKKILDVLKLSGVNYKWINNTLNVNKSHVNNFNFNAKNCPDLIPALVILALFAQGESKISGANRLKAKESSRAEVLKEELFKLGVEITIDNDLITVSGGQSINSGILDSHQDHRIAMALSILAITADSEIEITNCECINKSYPTFFDDLKLVGASFLIS